MPEGITEFSVQVNGETATVVYETKTEEGGKEEEWQPQEGEIVFATNGGLLREENFIFPFGHMKEANMENIRGAWDFNIDMSEEWFCHAIRPATDEEKKMFNDALKEKGLRWNAEEKKVEPIPRWRADKNEEYYYVRADAEVEPDLENGWSGDNTCYSIGNYFKTREAAERVAEQIREIFKNSKSE